MSCSSLPIWNSPEGTQTMTISSAGRTYVVPSDGPSGDREQPVTERAAKISRKGNLCFTS
jgi:hypothetical protein